MTQVREILPGVFRWTRFVKPGIPGSSYWIATPQGPIVVDPLIPHEGLERIAELGAPRALVLTNHEHERDAAAFQARFGARCYANIEPENGVSRRGMRFLTGTTLLDTFRTIDLGGIRTGEAGFLLAREGGILIVGDAFLNFNPHDSAMTILAGLFLPYGPPSPYPAWYSLRPRESRQQLAALEELSFEHLLLSHGEPVIGGASKRVADALERERTVQPFLFEARK